MLNRSVLCCVIYIPLNVIQNATVTVAITITDINDNNPIFDSFPSFSIMEQSVNAYVGTLHATDADLGLNGQIMYSLPYYETYVLAF